jgi:hypothetical protein
LSDITLRKPWIVGIIISFEGYDTSASSCWWSIVAQSIEQGSVDELDISCLDEMKPLFAAGDASSIT